MSPVPHFGHFMPSMRFCFTYLHFGYPEQETNSPYAPCRNTNGLPHTGQSSPVGCATFCFCCCFWLSLRIVLHGGSSLYPGHAMYGPKMPRRNTITRPQLSQYSSCSPASCPSGVFRSGLAAVFSFVNRSEERHVGK